MSDPAGTPPTTGSADLNVTALYFFGLLLLLGGGLMLAVLFGIRQFPMIMRDGAPAYGVPGSGGRHVIDSGFSVVLAGAGGLLTLLGVVGLATGRVLSRRAPRPSRVIKARAPRRRSWRPIATLVIGASVLVAVIVFRRHMPP